MDSLLLFPVLFPMLSAFAVYFVTKGAATKNKYFTSDLTVILSAFIAFTSSVFLWFYGQGYSFKLPFVLVDGISFTSGGFRGLYLVICCFMWLVTAVFSREYFSKHRHNLARYYFFFFATEGATAAVFLSADLITTFLFFEILSFTSFVWVIHDENEYAARAAKTYLAVAVIGGLVLFMGLLLLKKELGTLEIALLKEAASAVPDRSSLYPAGLCILFGFGAKAGMFPLHIWLPKAHPVAPAPASALLSGILTKVGIFGIAAISVNVFFGDSAWGSVLLLLGLITMLLGALLAVFSVDLKRTLACSSMSQIGFILVGLASISMLGEEGAISASGVLLHMANHSVFKLVLFVSAGVVFMNTHMLNLNDIRGFGRKKPLLLIPFTIGAAGISGIPLLSGYISKTLLHEGLIELPSLYMGFVPTVAEWIFLISGGLTFAYMTKLFVVLFVEKGDKDFGKKYISPLSSFVLLLASVPVVICGIPYIAKKVVASATDFLLGLGYGEGCVLLETEFFSLEALKGAAISITIGLLVYFLFIRPFTIRKGNYVNLLPASLDLENMIYRPLILKLLPNFFYFILSIFEQNKLTALLARAAYYTGAFIARAASDSLDFLILITRKTFLRETKVKGHVHKGSLVGETLGHIADKLSHRTVKNSLVLHFIVLEKRLRESTKMISDSFSFALLLTCLGVCFTMIFLLLS